MMGCMGSINWESMFLIMINNFRTLQCLQTNLLVHRIEKQFEILYDHDQLISKCM